MANFQKFLSTAPVLIMALLTFTAVLLIVVNQIAPDRLFFSLT